MSEITIIATFPALTADNLSEFTKQAHDAIESARSEPGTLQFDWYLPDDQSTCIVIEKYTDSAAVLAHLGNSGPGIASLAKLAGGLSLQVFGEVSSELREALKGANPPIYTRFAGR